jgi:hypothetical protein
MLAAHHQQQQQMQGYRIPSTGLPWWSPGSGANKLQRWFGVDLFVLLQPASYSRRFLDAAESSSLLSVARLALSSAGVCWPLLLPVHDALRDAYVGVAQVIAGGGGRVAAGGWVDRPMGGEGRFPLLGGCCVLRQPLLLWMLLSHRLCCQLQGSSVAGRCC